MPSDVSAPGSALPVPSQRDTSPVVGLIRLITLLNVSATNSAPPSSASATPSGCWKRAADPLPSTSPNPKRLLLPATLVVTPPSALVSTARIVDDSESATYSTF